MRRIRDIRVHPIRRIRTFRIRTTESDIVRRVSIAGLVVAILWMVAITVVNTVQVEDLLNKSTVEDQLREQDKKLEDQSGKLEDQDVQIQRALDEIDALHTQLEVAAVQGEALMNQLRSLNVEPVVIVRRVPVSSGGSTSPPPTTTTTTDKAPGQNRDKANQK